MQRKSDDKMALLSYMYPHCNKKNVFFRSDRLGKKSLPESIFFRNKQRFRVHKNY